MPNPFNLLGKLLPKDKKKKNKIDGTANFAIKILKWIPVVKITLIVVVILLIVSFAYDIFHWTTDDNSSRNNPKALYDMIGADDLNALICVAGNETDGYYLAFRRGVEERIDEVVKEYTKADYQDVSKDILMKMIQAELYTKYPDLGGKIGHEANIKLRQNTRIFSGGVMDIPHVYQNGNNKKTHSGNTVAGAGCGPCSLTMVLQYLIGEDITIDDVMGWCDYSDSPYFNGNGSEEALFQGAADHWGIGTVTKSCDIEEAKQALREGKPVIMRTNGNLNHMFAARNDHFIVLKGVDEQGNIYINNPNQDRAESDNHYGKESFSTETVQTCQYSPKTTSYFIFEYGSTISVSAQTELHWPTQADKQTITSFFGPREAPIEGASTNHGAIDIAVDTGTEVYACAPGKVTEAHDANDNNGGKYIIIEHDDGYVSKYLHNSELKVATGDEVLAGQVIALSGNTGNSTGPHLHFQIEKDGTKVNPLNFSYDNGMGNGTEEFPGILGSKSTIKNLDGYLFIGDSIMKGLNDSGVVDDDVTILGYDDATQVKWLENYWDKLPADSDNIKGINVMLGANTIRRIPKMQEFLEKLHEKYKNKNIFVDRLLPINTGEEGIDEARNEFNKQMLNFCEEHDGFAYIDPTSGVEVESNGINPANKEQYEKLWKNIRAIIISSGIQEKTESGKNLYPLVVGTDTGEGREGFQGAIRIRRVTPNKTIGVVSGAGIGATSSVLSSSGRFVGDITSYLSEKGAEGNWAVYAKNLKTDEEAVNLNGNNQMQSASLIKLFIAATVYQEQKDGRQIEGAEELIKTMINDSNNDSANALIDKLQKDGKTGFDVINEYIQKNEYTQTSINRKMLEQNPTGDNYTSVADVAKILQEIYEGKCVDKESSGKILQYMNEQTHRNKIPQGIPGGVQVANKTGELDTVENDSAIVYKDGAPFVLVVMSSNLSDTAKARSNIADIAGIVYEKIDQEGESTSSPSLLGTLNKKEQSNKTNESSLLGTKEEKHTIAIVAGHGISEGAEKGWYETGTEDTTGVTNPPLQEKDLTLKVANYVKQIFENDYPQFTVVTDGYSEKNEDRLKIAKQKGAEIFVGVHFNSNSSDSVKGTGVYYEPESKYKNETEKLAKALQKSIMTEMGTEEADGVTEKSYKAFSEGRQDEFGGPALYVEGAFMSNKEDMEIIAKEDDEGLKAYAKGIVAGILDYYGVKNDGYSEIETSASSGDKVTSNNQSVTTTINSKIYDLKYIPEAEFNKLISNKDESVLQYYTLDKEWNLIIAKWTYSSESGVRFMKNKAINYGTVLQKYTTPFEYLLNFYIDIKDDDFINAFADLVLDSQFIIAVQDNVNTTETTITTEIVYDDGDRGGPEITKKVNETVSTSIELTYADTWFVKFAKESSYEAAALESSKGTLVGTQGRSLGTYKLTSYCYICNDDGQGNFGTSITASGVQATPNRTVAIHNAATGGDPNGLKLGDKIMFNGNVYVVEDTGTGKPGPWLDVYVEATSNSRSNCCSNSPFADGEVEVFLADDVRPVTSEDTEIDGTKFINTIANVKGKSTDTKTAYFRTEEGPVKRGLGYGDVSIASTKYITTRTHNVSNKYETGEGEVKSNEKKFIQLFKTYPEAKNSLKNDWLIRIIRNGERTAQFTDLTKYLLYKVTGDKQFKGISIDQILARYKNNEFASTRGLRGNTIQEKVWVALRSLDYSEEAVAGAMGNIHYESGSFNPEAVEGGYNFDVAGIGICQWTNYPRDSGEGRHTNLIRYAESKGKEWSDPDVQVEFLVAELTSGGGANGFASYELMSNNGYTPQDWVGATSVDTATEAFCWTFERPNKSAGNSSMAQRKQYAQQYYDQFHGIPLSQFGGGDIIDSCNEVVKYWMSKGVRYSVSEDKLIWGNIEASYESQYACCATYVTSVLYNAGYLTEDDINGYNYHWTGNDGVPAMLLAAGWTKLDDISEAQEGDVLNVPKIHVMIYGGGNLIWDESCAVISSGGSPPSGAPKSLFNYYVSKYGDIDVYRAP